jgi:hypothetical protein
MSNALAIASVTAAMKDLLDNAIIDHSLSTTVGDRITVTSLPPDRIDTGGNEKAQLNLLYNVMPDQGWRNVSLPSHNAQGERLTNQPLALDLYYLLTAYVMQDFDAEILLGYAMQTLHEMPVLTCNAIRRALAPTSPVSGDMLPPEVGYLSASDLAEQVELIKISPHQMSTEEISKLWSAFQSNYRPSVAYHVSVVLIESRRSTRSALPVRGRNLYTSPFSQPVIEKVMSEEGEDTPILADSSLVILGRQLRGNSIIVLIGGFEITPSPENLTEIQISIPLPSGLRAGVQGAQVVQQMLIGTPPTLHLGVESNVSAFVLCPIITPSVSNVTESTVNDHTLYSADVTVNFNPAVGRMQRVIMLLNEFNPPSDRPARSYSFQAQSRDEDVNSIIFHISNVEAGEYLVRVQVDGAESPMDVDTDQDSPTFNHYINPRVTIS